MKKILFVASMFIGSFAYAGTSTPSPVLVPATVVVSSVSAAAGQASITISTPTGIGSYSSGYYVYLTNVHIEMYATGTLTGGATPVTCTSTGLPNSVVWKFPTASATGTTSITDMKFVNPIQSTQATNVTVTCPGTASVIWNVVLTYYTGS